MDTDLFEYRKNHYSQNGEDGIIEELFSRLKIEKGFFVEFGAWDGMHWSNTLNLYKKGWTGCLIEGDEDRFHQLCENIPDNKIIKINLFVEKSGDNSLDQILLRQDVKEVDFLSIDIDSNDLLVWEGVRNFEPTVVIIEYNPTIPFDTRYINPEGKINGNSALSIYESARNRGYVLVEGTDLNLIFVKEKVAKENKIRVKSLQEIKDQTFQLRYFFSQDGTLLHNYSKLNDEGITELFPIPWTLSFGIQPVPKIFRRYSEGLNYGAIIILVISAIFRCPVQLAKLARLFVRTVSHDRSFSETISLIMNKGKLTRSLREK